MDKLGVEAPVESAELTLDYKEGDSVELLAGVMKGFAGQVASIDLAAKKVKVLISFAGRQTPAELDLDQVKPV